MKLRKRAETKVKVEKKEKPTVEVKKEKVSGTVKRKRKGRGERSKKNKGSNKKPPETMEVIEIPPVVHCAINDVVEAMDEATKEELELKEECTLLFECNQCESFFRSLGSYFSHKISFCSETSSDNLDQDLVHKVYAWPFLANIKEEVQEDFEPLLIDIKVEEETDLSDY